MAEDNALAILEKIRNANSPDLSQAVLRQCYEIQKQYQYESDPSLAMNDFQRLIENEIARQMDLATDKKKGP
jgi:hypothetical protein